MNGIISWYFIIAFGILFLALIKKGYKIPDLTITEIIKSVLIITFWFPAAVYVFLKEVL